MENAAKPTVYRKADEELPSSKNRPPAWTDALRKHRLITFAVTGLLIAAVFTLAVWQITVGSYISTDDAFIDDRAVPISSQVNAAIVDVPVTDNELVAAGSVLVRLDNRDFKEQANRAQAQIDQYKANIAHADAELGALDARVDQANKEAAQSQAALTFAEQEDQRYQRLVKTGAVTVEQAQQYASNLLQARAAFAAAQANAVAMKKQLPVLQAQRKQADAELQQGEVSLKQADINLSRTVIEAPAAGRVARLTAGPGEYATVGQPLLMFIPRQVWVTANFKETALHYLHPGAPVDVQIDAYPGRTFKGHVDTVQPGSGTAFSLLPPENATGNYVKIVQRVPVKIVFNRPPDVLLGPGMSVVPKVRVR